MKTLTATLTLLLSLWALPAMADSATPAQQLTDTEWRSWADHYLAQVSAQERVEGLNPYGSIAGERTATSIAQRLFRERLGREMAEAEAPFRAFRRRNLWLVVGSARPPGEGLLLVLSRDAGAVMRVQDGPEPTETP